MKLTAGSGQQFRRHPAYICVLLSEWDVWADASSVPLGRLSWQPAYLLQALCRPSRVCVTPLLFFLIISSLHWHQDVSSRFLWNRALALCGGSLMALLPSHFWGQLLLIAPMTTYPCHTFPFHAMPRNDRTLDVSIPTYHLFTGNLSWVA